MGSIGDGEGAARTGACKGRRLDAGEVDVGKVDRVLRRHAGHRAREARGCRLGCREVDLGIAQLVHPVDREMPVAGSVIEITGRNRTAIEIAGREQRGRSKILARYGGQIGRRHHRRHWPRRKRSPRTPGRAVIDPGIELIESRLPRSRWSAPTGPP
jgi:hypothetical protein